MRPQKLMEPNSWFFSRKFLDPLDPHILLIHEEATDADHKLTLRFQNGFGAEILQLFRGGKKPSFFKVLVLKFSGAKIKDSQPASNIRLPQGKWLNDPKKIIHLCRQVALLPATRRRSSLH